MVYVNVSCCVPTYTSMVESRAARGTALLDAGANCYGVIIDVEGQKSMVVESKIIVFAEVVKT